MFLAAFRANKTAQLETAKKAQQAVAAVTVNALKLAPTGRANFRAAHKYLVDKIVEQIKHSNCFLYI